MLNREIVPIKLKLNTPHNNVKIYVLSDMHLGEANVDMISLKKIIAFIKDTPECYVILLGDILNTALKNSKSDIYSETLSVADTQKLAIELLSPIKEKIIAMSPGNHENRIWREVGIDISLWLAEKLGIKDKYRNTAIALNLQFGKDQNNRPYNLTVFGQHGSYGGGRRLGSAMNALEDLDGIVGNADIYIRAHTHQPIQGSRDIFLFNSLGNITKSTKYYFNSPAVMTYGGYAADKGYRPTDSTPCYLNIRGVCERKGTKLYKSLKIDKVML